MAGLRKFYRNFIGLKTFKLWSSQGGSIQSNISACGDIQIVPDSYRIQRCASDRDGVIMISSLRDEREAVIGPSFAERLYVVYKG